MAGDWEFVKQLLDALALCMDMLAVKTLNRVAQWDTIS